MSDIETFCRQVRARSTEHRQAMLALRALPGQMISILRQEVDSLVRAVFLLSQKDRQYRSRLIEDAKIADNLECYVKQLERDEDLEGDAV